MGETENHTFDVVEVMATLPHRYPFLMIDKIIECPKFTTGKRVGRKIKAIKNVTINEPYFIGHFPGRPIMPGVMLIEAMAQAGAMTCYHPDDGKFDIAIAKIDNARFKTPVVPGDTLVLTGEVVKDRGSMVLLKCAAYVDDNLVAEADILAVMRPI